MEIELLRADITSLKVDAIVNPSLPNLQHVGTLGRVLVREGGKIIQKESSQIGPVPVGTAVVTTGGNLLCKFIIHAVGPRMGEGDEERKMRSACWSALQRAEELAIASVAFPAMSAGIFGLPLERCAHIMLGASIDFRPQARSLRRVVFCLFGQQPFDIFARILGELDA
jgi:O-acetyl-ADP-ribose deacetylase (regulator of RNase III)